MLRQILSKKEKGKPQRMIARGKGNVKKRYHFTNKKLGPYKIPSVMAFC